MKGVALGFSFLTLFSVIVAVLVQMGSYLDILLDSHTDINVAVFSSFSIGVALINASIVYGLSRQKVWAIVLGSIEMVLLIIIVGANLVSDGLSGILGSVYWLVIASFFLLALRTEYNEIKRQQVSHV